MSSRITSILALAAILSTLGAALPVAADDPPVFKHWQTEYRRTAPGGGESEDWALTVRQTSDGGYLAGGFADGACGNPVPSLFKMDAHGEVQWHFLFDAGHPCGFGSFGEVLEVEDGYVAVGRKGFFNLLPGGNRMFFVKVDHHGKILIQRVLNGIRPTSDTSTRSGGRAVRRTADGGFILSGSMTLGTGQVDLLLMKLSASGSTQWARTYSGCSNGGEDANAVIPITDPTTGQAAGYVLAGRACDDLIVARAELNGDLLWTVKIDSGPIFPATVGVSLSGGPFKPFSYSPEYTTSGPCAPASPTHVDLAQSVEQSRDLDHLIVGAHFNRYEPGDPGNGTACPALNAAYGILTPEYLEADGILLRLDLDGHVDLLRNVAHCSGLDFATKVRETAQPEGDGYVFSCTTADAGVVTPGDPTNMYLVKTDLAGTREWARPFKGAGTGACAFDVSVTNDGGYVVSGNNLDNDDDYTVIKLYSGCQPHAAFDLEDVEIPPGTETVWDSSRTVKGTVTVQPGGRLIIEGPTTEIGFFDTRQINDFDAISRRAGLVVEPGGYLEIRRATLGGLDACNGMWEGVQVLGDPEKSQRPVTQQGRLVARNGATIRDAVVGVHVGGTTYNENGHLAATFTHAGGIVQMKGARLLDDRKGVAFLPYLPPPPHPNAINLSYFNDVTFESDAFMRDPDYVTPDGRRVAVNEHLSLFGVRGVRVSGSTFRNTVPATELDPDVRGTGIAAFDATFSVSEGCQSLPIFPFPNCLEPDPTEFQGLTAGIVSGTTLFDRRMSVSGSRFSEVQQGITSVGQYFDSISDNVFDLPPGVVIPVHGVLMDAASGFSLRRNELGAGLAFGNSGVVVRDSGSLPSRIQDSSFTGMATGIRTLGANPELDVFCNTFEANPAGALVVGDGYLKPQGEGCGPGDLRADNTFLSPGLTHLYSFGSQSLVYRHASGPLNTLGDVTVKCLVPPRAPQCPRPPACNPVCPFVGEGPLDTRSEGSPATAASGEAGAFETVRRLLEMDRTEEAIDALSDLDSPAARELLIEIHIERGELDIARALLSELPRQTAGGEAFQRLYGLKLRLAEQGRETWDLTDAEVATLHELEATPGRIGWIAARWLLEVERR